MLSPARLLIVETCSTDSAIIKIRNVDISFADIERFVIINNATKTKTAQLPRQPQTAELFRRRTVKFNLCLSKKNVRNINRYNRLN